MFNNIYQGKTILVTGHTGFKGSWLARWLAILGAKVVGVSLRPDKPISHFSLLSMDVENHFIDIRDNDSIHNLFKKIQPDFVFHLAAQALVIPSYDDPIETWSTNVMGTTHILEAMRNTSCVIGGVMITTDKCYKNKESVDGYNEDDELGGHDPYSASKAACELVIESYRSAFWKADNAPMVASVRAGNVIGGGDWSDYRIIPDIVRSMENNDPMILRNPQSVRPWQHVLESLSGYLILGEKLLNKQSQFARAYNFGPQGNDVVPVVDIVQKFKYAFPNLKYEIITPDQNKPHETNFLKLDSSRAVHDLDWMPVWNTSEGIQKTIDWYDAYLNNNDVITDKQIEIYCNMAKTNKNHWAVAA